MTGEFSDFPSFSTATDTGSAESAERDDILLHELALSQNEDGWLTWSQLNTADLADLEWHTISTTDVVQRLNSSLKDGLSSDQVKDRLQRYGKNAPSPPQTHRFKTIVGYFFKGFGAILLIAAVLVFIAWKPLGDPPAQSNLALAIVLVAVFIIQAGFNMWQDWSSSRVMSSIKNMLPEECQVIRDSAQMTLFASELVPGDVLLVKAGNKLPADIRVAQVSSDVKFDRSILTGKFFS